MRVAGLDQKGSPRHNGTSIQQFSLASVIEVCNNYVMRSTRHVVNEEKPPELGHYSDPPLLVLSSLSSGPKHGHAMIEDILGLCGTRLGPGTLYGAIARLEQQGWIEPLPADDRRQPYRITAEGLRVLRARLATLQQFIKAGVKRLDPL
jgi:DNA-binding MarR family transcriptional regulator